MQIRDGKPHGGVAFVGGQPGDIAGIAILELVTFTQAEDPVGSGHRQGTDRIGSDKVLAAQPKAARAFRERNLVHPAVRVIVQWAMQTSG